MPKETLVTREHVIETKRISVSRKRQITIPQRFFEKLHIGEEVECIMTNSEIIIRPVRQETEFAEEILKDLITKGYQGEELLAQFRKARTGIRPAINRIIEEAEEVARNLSNSGDDVVREIFPEED